MNKRILIPLFVIVVLVFSAGGYILYVKSSKTVGTNSGETQVMQSDATQDSSSPNSLRELLSLGVSQKCTYTDNEFGSQGTAYIADGRMRGDFSINTNTSKVNSHTIVDGENVYVWTDGQTEGYKMTSTMTGEPQETGEGSSPLTSESVNLDQKVDYNCVPWSTDDSMFSLPAGIEFKDFSQMMESVTGMMDRVENEDEGGVEEENTSSKEDQCEYCNSLPAEAQQQCLAAFGCSL